MNLLTLLLLLVLSAPATAQTCQTIMLPDGRIIVCCTSGSITTCSAV